jgi:hypothetical protein
VPPLASSEYQSVWNNNRLIHKLAAVLLALTTAVSIKAAELPEHSPQLLLTAQRLRRLKRDRERQTARWTNFENRVNAAPESVERGFELALYYAVTGDEARGKEAVRWALAHPCERRQAALVMDWTGGLASAAELKELTTHACPGAKAGSAEAFRDAAFLKIVAGEDLSSLVEESRKSLIPKLADGGFLDAKELYAACEYMAAVRTGARIDLREDQSVFFLHLPEQFLLAMPPAKLEKPDEIAHLAALALISLDPNLESSQFLQGWAIEDRQTIREGAGVAYELLWADPYLPGVGYQNMDRWVYDPQGRLFARADWQTESCYIEISVSGVKEENCAAGWRDGPATFGRLTLIPIAQDCVDIPHVQNNESVIVWRLQPHEQMILAKRKQDKQEKQWGQADAAGLWRPGANIEGKACRQH